MGYKDRIEIIKEAVKIVKSLGYKCYYPIYRSYKNEEPTYCFITNGKYISYMQSNTWGYNLEFSTIRKVGNSCCVYKNESRDRDFCLAAITKEVIERTFGQPIWGATESDKSYRDWDDFVKNSLTGKIAEDIVEL